MNLTGIVDQPREGDFCYRQRIPVKGWVHAGYRHDKIRRISVHAPNGEIGATTQLYPRADVALAHQLGPEVRTGFRLLAVFEPGGPPPAVLGIEVRVEFTDGTMTPLAGIHIQILPHDQLDRPPGTLCHPRHAGEITREQVFDATTAAEGADPDCVELIAEYLPPGISLVDAGCGVGAYCEPLRARGFSWLGCEASLDCTHELALHSRPHRHIRRGLFPWSRFRLPAADHEFDAALSLGGLGRLSRPDPFLAELARVTRRHAIVTVPSLEPLPFLTGRRVAPRFLLDRAQANFYTRFNLRPLLLRHFRQVEVLDFGSQSLASPDGLPLPPQLFALCEV